MNCKVKDLLIGGNNNIGEDQQLYSTLINPSVLLEQLSIGDTQLSTTAAIDLFTALEYNNILKKLYIAHNNITDNACDAIITGLERKSGWIASYSTTLLKDDDIVATFLQYTHACTFAQWELIFTRLFCFTKKAKISTPRKKPAIWYTFVM